MEAHQDNGAGRENTGGGGNGNNPEQVKVKRSGPGSGDDMTTSAVYVSRIQGGGCDTSRNPAGGIIAALDGGRRNQVMVGVEQYDSILRPEAQADNLIKKEAKGGIITDIDAAYRGEKWRVEQDQRKGSFVVIYSKFYARNDPNKLLNRAQAVRCIREAVHMPDEVNLIKGYFQLMPGTAIRESDLKNLDGYEGTRTNSGHSDLKLAEWVQCRIPQRLKDFEALKALNQKLGLPQGHSVDEFEFKRIEELVGLRETKVPKLGRSDADIERWIAALDNDERQTLISTASSKSQERIDKIRRSCEKGFRDSNDTYFFTDNVVSHVLKPGQEYAVASQKLWAMNGTSIKYNTDTLVPELNPEQRESYERSLKYRELFEQINNWRELMNFGEDGRPQGAMKVKVKEMATLISEFEKLAALDNFSIDAANSGIAAPEQSEAIISATRARYALESRGPDITKLRIFDKLKLPGVQKFFDKHTPTIAGISGAALGIGAWTLIPTIGLSGVALVGAGILGLAAIKAIADYPKLKAWKKELRENGFEDRSIPWKLNPTLISATWGFVGGLTATASFYALPALAVKFFGAGPAFVFIGKFAGYYGVARSINWATEMGYRRLSVYIEKRDLDLVMAAGAKKAVFNVGAVCDILTERLGDTKYATFKRLVPKDWRKWVKEDAPRNIQESEDPDTADILKVRVPKLQPDGTTVYEYKKVENTNRPQRDTRPTCFKFINREEFLKEHSIAEALEMDDLITRLNNVQRINFVYGPKLEDIGPKMWNRAKEPLKPQHPYPSLKAKLESISDPGERTRNYDLLDQHVKEEIEKYNSELANWSSTAQGGGVIEQALLTRSKIPLEQQNVLTEDVLQIQKILRLRSEAVMCDHLRDTLPNLDGRSLEVNQYGRKVNIKRNIFNGNQSNASAAVSDVLKQSDFLGGKLAAPFPKEFPFVGIEGDPSTYDIGRFLGRILLVRLGIKEVMNNWPRATNNPDVRTAAEEKAKNQIGQALAHGDSKGIQHFLGLMMNIEYGNVAKLRHVFKTVPILKWV